MFYYQSIIEKFFSFRREKSFFPFCTDPPNILETQGRIMYGKEEGGNSGEKNLLTPLPTPSYMWKMCHLSSISSLLLSAGGMKHENLLREREQGKRGRGNRLSRPIFINSRSESLFFSRPFSPRRRRREENPWIFIASPPFSRSHPPPKMPRNKIRLTKIFFST